LVVELPRSSHDTTAEVKRTHHKSLSEESASKYLRDFSVGSSKTAEAKLKNPDNAKHQKTLKELLSLPGNRYCADCGAQGEIKCGYNNDTRPYLGFNQFGNICMFKLLWNSPITWYAYK
jgi:hypothetical protein